MKYVIWVVRFWYAGWMIPAGIEHFYHIYPQPGAHSSHPLAAEMLQALLDTHLFDVVKAVELSGVPGLLFRRNSITGAVEVLARTGAGVSLNAALHA